MEKKIENIVLVGYMASGKSTIGKLLAQDLEKEFVDLDAYIEEHIKMSIPEIFKEKGEVFFRKLEHTLLNEILDSNKGVLLATGGGAPCYSGNMDVILEKSNAVYLQLTVPSLVDRIKKEKDHRPLVKDISDEGLPEFIGKHLFERMPFYAKAQTIIVCDNKGIDAIVEEIKEVLG